MALASRRCAASDIRCGVFAVSLSWALDALEAEKSVLTEQHVVCVEEIVVSSCVNCECYCCLSCLLETEWGLGHFIHCYLYSSMDIPGGCNG